MIDRALNPPAPTAAAAETISNRSQRLAFLVGVDGGGTGTRARLQDRQGHTLGFGSAGPSGLGQGVAQAWRHVERAVAAAFDAGGLQVAARDRIGLGLGLAGAGVPAQRASFLVSDPGYAVCLLETDAAAQLAGAHGGRPGLVVACGTGSVAAARYADGTTRQVGGWGFPVGDEGSGAWLGLRAMQIAHAVVDRRAESSPLAELIFDAVGRDPDALLAWCAGAGQAAYATLAPQVFAAAERGDANAVALLQTTADELARLVDALQLGQEPLPIVIVGSVGERLGPYWSEAIRERVVPAAGDGADGALHLLRGVLAAADAGGQP
jgi:glucosamine kinase